MDWLTWLVHPGDVERCELVCGICRDVLFTPVGSMTCSHVFCKLCCDPLTHCAICRSPWLPQPNWFLLRLTNNLKMQCPRCSWAGPHVEARHHDCAPLRIHCSQCCQHWDWNDWLEHPCVLQQRSRFTVALLTAVCFVGWVYVVKTWILPYTNRTKCSGSRR